LRNVRFGLRQLLLDVTIERRMNYCEPKAMAVSFELGNQEYPNIVSSYPAEEIFIHGSPKIFTKNFNPRLQATVEINISNSNQSLHLCLVTSINSFT
jgi:hypothetical protein